MKGYDNNGDAITTSRKKASMP